MFILFINVHGSVLFLLLYLLYTKGPTLACANVLGGLTLQVSNVCVLLFHVCISLFGVVSSVVFVNKRRLMLYFHLYTAGLRHGSSSRRPRRARGAGNDSDAIDIDFDADVDGDGDGDGGGGGGGRRCGRK
jgi:hypothetical protein